MLQLKTPIAASLLATLLAGGSALAQTASNPEPAGVEEVVVTAQRRSENLQDVPLAVTALSPRQLEAQQIRDTTDLTRFVPSVTGGLNTGTGSALTFYIRGLGSTEQIASFDVPVATYVDEIYFARQNANAVSLFDVEQVEVLRGPQGTLFGRNTTGGAVSITLRKPAPEFGWFVETSYGSFDRQLLRGAVDVPLSDKVLTKVSAFRVDDAGYGRSLTTGEKLNGEDASGARAAVRLLPSAATTWDLSVDYVDQAKTTLGSNPVDPAYASRSGLRAGECDQDVINTYLTYSLGNCARVRTAGLTSNLRHDLGWATVNLITGYRSVDQGFVIDFFNGASSRGGYVMASEITNQQFTQELKLTGQTGRARWVAGLFYLDEDNKTAQVDYFSRLISDWVMKNGATSSAIYAQADIALSDPLTLTVGGRYTHEEKTLAYYDTGKASYPAGITVALPAAALRLTSANLVARGIPLEQTTERFTPRVALSYKLDDDRMLFVSATNGFKSGGWNTRVTSAAGVTIFGPEKAWSYETGARTDWLDRRLRVNATAYYEDVQDLQMLASTGGASFVTRNSGDLRAYGLELEVSASPTPALDLFAGGSAAHREYANVPARFGGSAGTIPCSTRPEPTNCTTTGDTPVRFPSVQATLGVSYRVPAPDLNGSFSLNGSLSYSQAFWTSSYNDGATITATPYGGTTPVITSFAKTPASTLANVGIVYRDDEGHWEAALECSNCGESYYATASLFGVGYYNDPRRVTLRVKYRY
ncbi:TonB-dependent receptor [Caulobacter hibisci]|uniref:TonB-dependent receptor n=1 Tax=Caulobacter hibisci TaxID=2035993 RepID=A0ABS0SY25_9CAUL|nr:TonB-dependent receptor [Caulobacter hibisci]MBI1684537.1 TonB-dependent receptor [Caulobacter hibisci]